LDSLGVCLQPLIGVHYHLSIPFLHSSLFFIHPIRNLASLFNINRTGIARTCSSIPAQKPLQ